jgi:ParB family chromosome partitioning protein
MGRLEEVQRKYGANIEESIGLGPRHSANARPPLGAMPALRDRGGERKGTTRSADTLDIEIGRIMPDPDQPRREFDEATIDRMAASLAKQGQIMPIAVRWSEATDRYIIVAGERRWRGAMKAGLATLKAVVRDPSAPVAAGGLLALQLVENIHREDLSPMDQARAYRRLLDDNGWTGARLASELEIDHSRIVHALALLELPAPVRERVELEELSPTGAYEISTIADPVVQEELAAKVVEGKWTRDEIRDEVRKVTAKGGARNPGKGRGGKKPARIVKPWKFRADNGARVTVEFARGLDLDDARVALAQALARFDPGAESAA